MPFAVLHCCRRKAPALRRKSAGNKFKNGLSGSWWGCLAGDGRGTAESCSLFSSPVATPLNLAAYVGIYKHSRASHFLKFGPMTKAALKREDSQILSHLCCFLLPAIVRESKRRSQIQRQAQWSWSQWLWERLALLL